MVDIVVPVYNEAADLEPSIRRLDSFLSHDFPFPTRITIVDNGSVDGTYVGARRLARDIPRVEYLRLELKGRGRALKAAWLTSEAPVVAYMDVDLSTDLSALLPLVAPLISDHSDVAIGSRLLPGSNVIRSPRRELISRAYNLLLRSTLRTRFRDAQCGFKAIRADVARRLLPRVEDQAWFFDTELLVLAQRAGFRILEVPVDWREDPDSRVDVVATAAGDLRGIAQVGLRIITGALRAELSGIPARSRPAAGLVRQVRRFAAIGVASTIAYVAIFSALRTLIAPELANALALLTTAVANTAANRRLTFGVRGASRQLQHHAAGLLAFAVALAMTSGALAGLEAVDRVPGPALSIAVLMLANISATATRFALLRTAIKRGGTAQASGRIVAA